VVTFVDQDESHPQERRRYPPRQALHESYRQPLTDPTLAVPDKSNLRLVEAQDRHGAGNGLVG